MKTIKNLNLHPGQEIEKVQQQFIMAGSGQLQWTGQCFCRKKGNFHSLTASETFEYIDWVEVGVASVLIAAGCAVIIVSGSGLNPVGNTVGGGLVGVGISEMVSVQKTGRINYAQRFECTGVNPLRHKAMPITCSVSY